MKLGACVRSVRVVVLVCGLSWQVLWADGNCVAQSNAGQSPPSLRQLEQPWGTPYPSGPLSPQQQFAPQQQIVPQQQFAAPPPFTAQPLEQAITPVQYAPNEYAQTPSTELLNQSYGYNAFPPPQAVAPQFETGPMTPLAGGPLVPSETILIEEPVTDGWIGLDTPTTWSMLDFQNRQGDKQLTLLESQANQGLYPHLIVGGQVRASGLVGHTNTANSFPYQGRFPTDFNGQTATDLRLLQANQNLIAHVSPWATGYVETLFSDVFTFPTFTQGSLQMRQAYAVIGNLDESPVYGFIGKKNVSFGDMRTLSPFSQSMVWHYFGALAEGGGIGYSSNGLNLTFSALAGSRGIRVADSTRKGHVNNFAANGSYEFSLPGDIDVMFGAGYLAGTIYDAATAEHTNPAISGPLNGAWDVNGRVRFGNLHFSGEYASTVNVWPATNHQVQAYRAEAAYDMPIFDMPAWWAVSWSEGIQGPSGSEFQFNQQLVLGVELQPSPNVSFTAEYVRSLGFAPLINVTTVSNRDVIQDSVVFGLVLAI